MAMKEDIGTVELQLLLTKRLDSFVSNYSKTPEERFSIGYLCQREKGLLSLWAEFIENHDAIGTLDTEDPDVAAYFADGVFDKYEAIYFDVAGRIQEKRHELSPPPPVVTVPIAAFTPAASPSPAAASVPVFASVPAFVPAPAVAHNPYQMPHHIQIPRLNVPNFDGTYDDWPSFHDLFIAAVHSNPTLLPVHKLQYLKSLLSGTAQVLLKHVSTTADNYAVAWKLLEDRFDNKRALINSTLRKFFGQRPVDESPTSIRQLLDSTRECIGALHIHGIDTASWDSILVYIVAQNVPSTSLDLWEQLIPRNQLPTIEQLLTFLEDRFRVLEFSAARTVTAPRTRNKPQSQVLHATSTGCRLCKEQSHPLRHCAKFLEMNPKQRMSYVTKAKLCRNCFAFSHQTQACHSAGTCSSCGERHHSLLHAASPNSQPSSAAASTSSNAVHPPSSTAASSSSSSSSVVQPQPTRARANALVSRPESIDADESILATALVVIKAHDGSAHSFRALLDNASQENFVSRRVMQFIGIKPEPTSMVVSGVGQCQAPKPLGQIVFEFGSHHDPTFAKKVSAIVLPRITHVLPARNVQVSRGFVDQLELADPTYGTPGAIDILLSASVFASLTLPSIRKANDTPTVALQTQLGWVLFGEASTHPTSRQRTCFHVTTEDSVSTALQEFWRIEEVDCTPRFSKDDEKCEQLYASTHTRTADGRYCVQIPFKDDPPRLGASRGQAVSRFLQVERKLTANSKLQKDYAKCINEYLELGHMHQIPTTEEHGITLSDGTSNHAAYYLPHHAVIKEESTTTKLRVVFDASSKTSNGVSLNKAMLVGPVLQDSLFTLLVRWRTPRIVLKADIAKMYRQVLVSEQHQPFQRIIWRNSPAEPLQEFQLRTVTFGTAAAPYLAIKTLQQIANDSADQFPLGAQMIKNDFYVDDLLSGADSLPEAIEKQRQVTAALMSGRFDIRKWASNDNRVTEDLDDAACELCSDSETLKALGIFWCPLKDTFSIKVSHVQIVVTSKRSLLAEISKLYDPLGWIAPAIICMKMLLQTLWLAGLDWDEPLPPMISAQWAQFQRQLSSIQSITIPRWIKAAPNVLIELHGFCDASEKAYAAAIYARVQISDNEWSVNLITAKTRVAAVKQVTLPRLELCGSVLMAKLFVAIKPIFDTARIHAWTDSEIVLSWLQGHPNRWATFVANRVAQIHTSIDAGVWHHVPSKDNPADCASRGVTPEELVVHPLWWHGPAWLAKDETHWPQKKKTDIVSTQLEAKRDKTTFISIVDNDTIDQILIDCSSLIKVENVIARILRWRKRSPSPSPNFTVAELSHARTIVLRHTQKTHFPDEFHQFSQSKALAKNSKLLSLNPFLDQEQLMRVGGRLQNASIPYDARHPIIVPRSSRFTELLVNEAHAETLHGSVALMQSHLRMQYWIVDARNTIRHIIHKCNTCYRYSNPALTQLMGQLPKPRVNVSAPFSHTGIDYAGPLSILLRRTPGRPSYSKGYICLFVCLATKAIHLELVGDMTAATFLAALSRFIGRRGKPSDLYSDNGTYFVRAAADIDADLQKTLKQHTAAAATSSSHRSIQWHFIPPAAPHFGGLWEAGVKSTKYHLKRIIGESHYTYEELSTTLCQIEGCLNSRPLCPMSSDPNDLEVLTPGHFLIGRPLCSRPQQSTLEIPANRLHQWQRIYNTTERFWRQWQSEYLSRLQQRPKWTTPAPNIQVGELVLLKEDNAPPSQWNLARIIEAHQGADGHVRVVTLKTATSTFKRPITKICRLPSQ